jgi:hypothetical protein
MPKVASNGDVSVVPGFATYVVLSKTQNSFEQLRAYPGNFIGGGADSGAACNLY